VLAPLEDILGYRFQNPALLREALTHPSALKNRKERGYERLEFLGDRVLGLVVADMLLTDFPSESEGKIAKRHAALVRKEALAGVAEKISLAGYVQAATHETRLGTTLQADACEALIGALYLDGGLETAARFVTRHWQPLLRASHTPPQDAKSALQEWAQGQGYERPRYRLVDASGPDHHLLFTVEVIVHGLEPVRAQANSKKQAEQQGAAAALRYLGLEDTP
jgi:ribonuclease-3